MSEHRGVAAHELADVDALDDTQRQLAQRVLDLAAANTAATLEPAQVEWLYRSLGALEPAAARPRTCSPSSRIPHRRQPAPPSFSPSTVHRSFERRTSFHTPHWVPEDQCKQREVPRKGTHMDIKKVTVAGGGVLGSQIAFQSAYSGYDVTIWLRSEGSIGRCQPKLDYLHATYLKTLDAMKQSPAAYAYGLMPKEDVTPEACEAAKQKVEAAYKGIKLTTDWDEAFNDADLVIEAVAENVQQKIDFYTELAKHLPERTIIDTNSSTLLPSQFAEATGRPEVPRAPLRQRDVAHPTAEVMRHAGTGDEAFEATIAFAASIRMIPLRVNKEQPGYLLNSMLVPFLSSAEALWANDVATPEDIDQRLDAGHRCPRRPVPHPRHRGPHHGIQHRHHGPARQGPQHRPGQDRGKAQGEDRQRRAGTQRRQGLLRVPQEVAASAK